MKKLLILFLTILSLNAQPSNDNCISATLLTVNALPLCGQTTVGATTQVGETKPCGATGAQTVWYKFVATQPNMDVWIDNLVTGGCNIASGVWSTGTCFPTTTLSCKGAIAPTDIWHHLVGLTVGNTYLISVVYGNGGICNAGQTFCISVVAPSQVSGYTQPLTGQSSTYVGTCMVNTCSGQFYDDGGLLGNYSNNINLVYRVFCPNVAGNCMRATVNYADMEQGFDYLQIRNGGTQNSPLLIQMGMYGNSVWTSTDPSGCLTFRFRSDASVVRAGFNISLSCVPCIGGPNGTDNNDCINATSICSNVNVTGYSTGPGLNSESCSGCTVGGENNSNWYQINIATSGLLYLTLNPTVNTDDYDFALYGPNTTCGALGTPIRCSYAATPNPGNTGMGNGAVDVSENVLGDSWVSPLSVTSGQTYYLMVNKWDPTPGSGFTLTWTGGVGGSSTASLDCIPLPVELISFEGLYKDNNIILDWSTSSETNSNYFGIEKMSNNFSIQEIGTVTSVGNSNTVQNYTFTDYNVETGQNYYRLVEYNNNGDGKTYDWILVDVSTNDDDTCCKEYYNLQGQPVKFEDLQSGIYIGITNNDKVIKISR